MCFAVPHIPSVWSAICFAALNWIWSLTGYWKVTTLASYPERGLLRKNFKGWVHEIAAGHWSLSGTISCVTDRIQFLPVTMTSRFLNFNSISYKEDRHEFASDRQEVPNAGHDVRHWGNIYFRRWFMLKIRFCHQNQQTEIFRNTHFELRINYVW